MTLRAATVRFYVDADLLGLAKVLAALRDDVTYPGDPGAVVRGRSRAPAPVAAADADEDWIPVVAAHGWVIISRDKRIHHRFGQLSLVRDHGATMVCVTGEAGHDRWTQLEAVMTNWRSIEAAYEEHPPFVYRVTRTDMNPLDIEEALDRLRHGRPPRP